MKSTLKTLLIGALAATGLAAPARAAGGAGDPTQPLVCPPPSAAQCSSPTWLQTPCGLQEVARFEAGQAPHCAATCAADPPDPEACQSPAWMTSACGRLESPRLLAALGQERGLPTDEDQAEASLCYPLIKGVEPDAVDTLGLAPDSLDAAPGEAAVITPGTIRPVTRARDGRVGQYFTGGATLYQSNRLRAWTRASSDKPGGSPADAMADAFAQLGFDANGADVASCREYVYEKFYDYSLFEDATEALGADWRAVFEVAYDDAGARTVECPTRLDLTDEPARGEEEEPARGEEEPARGEEAPARGEEAPARGEEEPARCLANPDDLPRSAIGRRGMLGLPLLARDGTPLPHPIRFPVEAQPKNAFFAVPAMDAETREQILAAPEVPFDLAPDLMGSCGYNLATPVFCDDKLYTRLVEGDAHRFQESFAWHAQKSAALAAAGFHDEQLYAFDQVAASFQELMFQRELQAGRIIAFWKAFQQGANAAVPLDVQQAIFDPSIYMHSAIAGGLRQQRGLANARMDVDQLGLFSLQAAYGDGMYVMSNDGVLPAEAFVPATAPQQLTDLALATGGPQSLDYLRHLQRGLMAIDAEIEAALHDAEALGCLDLGFANPCDWSPRHFAQRVQDLYGPEREADFRHCQENTPDGFAAIIGHDLGVQHAGERKYPAIRPTPGADLVTCFVGADGALGAAPDPDCADCNGWQHGTALVDHYFQCVEGYKALILDIVAAELGPEALNADKTLKLRGSSGELYQLGNDTFNVTLAYGFGWSLGEFEGFMDDETENHCQLKPEGYGHFDVEATALFFTQSLIHASAHARLGDGAGDDLPLPASVTPNRLEVQILDEDLFDPIDTVVDHQFNVVQDEWSEGGTLVSVQATFTIVFVPVTIKGGIAGEIGVAYGIDGEVPLEPQTGDCDLIRFTGTFSPFAQVDGFASVTIDAVIAEAGIRIDLTIIRIDLPFDVTVAIGLNDDLDLILDIETNLDLVVSLLSGALSVYFRILWEEYKGVIFSWDGLRFETNLLNAQLEVPLLPLRDAAIALSNM